VDPLGNPLAAADPTRFAVRYHHCATCQCFWCDACDDGARPCRRCGGALEAPTPRHALEIIFGGRARIPEHLLASVQRPGAVLLQPKRRGGN